MTVERPLTPGEIGMLSTIYGSAMDYSRVRVVDGRTADGTGFTPLNTIYSGAGRYREDYSLDPSLLTRGYFVHESSHSLQTQNGLPAFVRGAIPQLRAVLGQREEVYDYTDKLNEGVPFEDWNIEEQASYFEHLYIQRELVAEGTPSASIPSLDILEAVDTSNAYPGLLTGPIEREKSLLPDNQCFLADTPISLSDGSCLPIVDVSVGDVVQSYDHAGELVPGRVVRTFSKEVSHVLDFFGTGMTPGHVTLCGDGQFAGQHVPIMDILRSDGAIVKQDGTLVRAATACVVGSEGDHFVSAIVGDQLADGRFEVRTSGRIRVGTRVFDQDGADVSVMELIQQNNGLITDGGLIVTRGSDHPMPLVWTFGPALPKPEDYVLQRSGISLVDIYEANEWEAAGPRLSHPDAASQAFSN